MRKYKLQIIADDNHSNDLEHSVLVEMEMKAVNSSYVYDIGKVLSAFFPNTYTHVEEV